MTGNDIQRFEKMKIQIKEMYKEVSLLSKRSPDSAINEFKLRFVNNLLGIANDFLTGNYKPFDDFNIFSNDDLPTNSDIVMIISQYIECLEKFKFDNVVMLAGEWFWEINGEKSTIKTTRPPETFRR